MPFMKKSKNVNDQMEAINLRLNELSKKRDIKERDLQEQKLNIAKLLGVLAVGDDTKAEDSLKLARKSLGRLQETYNDLNEQINLLEGQRKNLERDLQESRLREIPELAEKRAGEFNQLLNECLNAVEALRDLHSKMKEKEKAFHTLLKEHQSACTQLNKIEPLDLKVSLGELALLNMPFRHFFEVPTFENLIVVLDQYKLRLENIAIFRRDNPDFEKNIARTQARDNQGYEVGTMLDHRSADSI